MPPKKSTTKGAKGKAKAQEKEEKKQVKVAKGAPKGKYFDLFFLSSFKVMLYIVRLYYEILSVICKLTQ